MARHFPVLESSLGGGSVHPITLGLLAFVFLLSSCTPTSSTRTTPTSTTRTVPTSIQNTLTDRLLDSIEARLRGDSRTTAQRTTTPTTERTTIQRVSTQRPTAQGIRDSKLTARRDSFTGRQTCEQTVTNTNDQHNVTVIARLSEHGVYTLTLLRRDLELATFPPISENGLLLRFADGTVRGFLVANHDFEFRSVIRSAVVLASEIHTAVVPGSFYIRLRDSVGDVRYRIVDKDRARQNNVDGVLTRQHIDPLRSFFELCL